MHVLNGNKIQTQHDKHYIMSARYTCPTNSYQYSHKYQLTNHASLTLTKSLLKHLNTRSPSRSQKNFPVWKTAFIQIKLACVLLRRHQKHASMFDQNKSTLPNRENMHMNYSFSLTTHIAARDNESIPNCNCSFWIKYVFQTKVEKIYFQKSDLVPTHTGWFTQCETLVSYGP